MRVGGQFGCPPVLATRPWLSFDRLSEPDGHGGFGNFTARLHGTLIGRQSVGIHGSVDVYQGEDGKLYVHDHDGRSAGQRKRWRGRPLLP